MPSPTIRIARPTNDLPALKNFYTGALGFQVLSSFANHNGFDGVMLGNPAYTWHLEFTYQHGVFVSGPPSKDNLLIFYLPNEDEWAAAVKKVEENGGQRVESENPWWDVEGVTFEDPDGWRIVLQNSGWGSDEVKKG